MLLPTLLIGATLIVTVGVAFARYRDTFHPALLMGPMLGFHYFYSPLVLESKSGFYGFLWEDHVARAQWVHLSGVLALCIGIHFGCRHFAARGSGTHSVDQLYDRGTLLRASLVLGLLGIASFVYGILYVGGFDDAYGRAYGGGYSSSGWIRDLALLCLPALLLFTVGRERKPLTRRELVLVVALASPYLIHGLLGARRGPTFMAFAGIAMVYYMARRTRPSLPTLLAGGAVLGLLMLALVANRQSLYWGSELNLEESPTKYFQPGGGNDFIYGAGLVIVMEETGEFNWGATYLTMLFVRPIPRAIWPTKYQDAAEFFGTPSMDENLGIDIATFKEVLGWTAAIGAAPGIVGDMWREFSWAMVFVLLGIGWLYGHAWYRTVTTEGAWMPVYGFLAALSLYLVMQTLEAMLYRFLFGLVPMLLILRRARQKRSQALARLVQRETVGA